MLRFSRWHLFKGLAAIVCVVSTVLFALIYFFPAPPSKISIATAFKGGAYELFGHRYQQILARSGVRAEVLLTDGSVENLKLLEDQNSGVQVAFVQGGVSNSNQASEVLSLGRINYQLFWVFYRATEKLDDLVQLKGKRIAVGPVGSGTEVVAAKVLSVSGVNAETATLLPLAGQNAVKALNDGRADAIFLAFAPDAPVIQGLLRDPNVRLMSFPRGEALTRIFPFLVRLVLPQGVIDFEKNIPAADVPLIGTTNAVLVRNDIHPALVGLLAQALKETHSEAGLFQRVEEFPTQIDPEYPVAAGAIDF
jgi:TRAP transporter TAXI family solute receptor